MTAAALTPSIVAKREFALSGITGTPPRIVEYYLEATKVTQNDWILLETAIGADTTKTLLDVHGIVIDSSSDLDVEDFTYDDSDDELFLAGSTVGTVKIWVRMKHA